jgi:methyl-accepting chemotaxis protein
MWRSIGLRARLAAMSGAFVIGLLGCALLQESTLAVVAVDGPVYAQLVADKDLLADILPPPLYALEARLVSAQLSSATTPAEVAELTGRLRQLRADYAAREAFWAELLPEGAIRTAVLEDARVASNTMFDTIEQEVVPAAETGDVAAAVRIDRERVQPAYLAHRAAIDHAVQLISASAEANAAAGRATVSSRRHWAWAATGLAVLFVVGLSTTLARHIAGGVQRSARAIQAMGERDLTVSVVSDGDDDLARMGQSLNRALAALRTAVGGFRTHATDVATRAVELQDVSEHLNARANATSRNSGEVGTAIQEVSERLAQISAASEELGGAIQEIARISTESAAIAADAVSKSATSEARVRRLNSSAQEIDAVLRAIGQVAEQTNLLALNATIEAARAGPAGKGFAVVANEVKELARQARAAAEDASQRIGGLQTDAQDALNSLVEITEVVQRMHAFQGSVAAAVTQQEAVTNEIQRSVTQAASASVQISAAVHDLAAASHETQASAATTMRAAEALGNTAATLREVACQFRVDRAA